MAKLDYRKTRSSSTDRYRWTASIINTGLGPGKKDKTPEQLAQIRRHFLMNCVRAELCGCPYPGVPRAIRTSHLLLKAGSAELVRKWVEQQPDLKEVTDLVTRRAADLASRPSSKR